MKCIKIIGALVICYLSIESVNGQQLYTSSEYGISYMVPDGFDLFEIPEEFRGMVSEDFLMAYRTSPTGINPSILINVDVIRSSDLDGGRMIHYQRELLSQTLGQSVEIENVENFASDEHPDILNAVFLVDAQKPYYNSIYYFFYNFSSDELIMWTMTCTYSAEEKYHYETIFRETASTFNYSN